MSDRAPGVLRVDLTARRVRSEAIPERWRRDFVGGKGLGARYLYDELAPGTDPLGPDNRLMFLVGPLTGRLPGEPRYAAVTKSPLTGTFLDSYAGGSFPGALAGALDGLLGRLVQGVADEPVRVEVEDGDATIHGSDGWGARSAEQGCADGLLRPLDPAGLQAAPDGTPATEDFLPGLLLPCAVGEAIWSYLLAVDAGAVEGALPSRIAGLFDPERVYPAVFDEPYPGPDRDPRG